MRQTDTVTIRTETGHAYLVAEYTPAIDTTSYGSRHETSDGRALLETAEGYTANTLGGGR